MFLAFTYLARGSEKCTWNSLNPLLPGAITSIKREGGGGWRKLLAVRFIDRKQALCDKNLKLRASKFTILNHQIGSYKFTGFFNRLSTQQFTSAVHVYNAIACGGPHFAYDSECLSLCLCLDMSFLRMCTRHYISGCALLHASMCVFISLCLFVSFFLCLCERVHSFMRVWPCSQWPVAFSPASREGGKWPLICPTFSPSPY